MTVTFGEDDTEPDIGNPQRLFSLTEVGIKGMVEPTRDGKWFLAVQRANFGQETENSERGERVVLVQNWFNEFASKKDAK